MAEAAITLFKNKKNAILALTLNLTLNPNASPNPNPNNNSKNKRVNEQLSVYSLLSYFRYERYVT